MHALCGGSRHGSCAGPLHARCAESSHGLCCVPRHLRATVQTPSLLLYTLQGYLNLFCANCGIMWRIPTYGSRLTTECMFDLGEPRLRRLEVTMFEGFTDEMVDLGGVQLRVRFGGDGPPLLLIHGHPRTSATWHRVAPRMAAAGFRVVCPDMRGYGRSS